MSDPQDPVVPPADEPLILRLDEGLAVMAVLAQLERHLIRDGAEAMLQRLDGLGRDGGMGHLSAVDGLPATPEVVDRATAIKYVETVKRRIQKRGTLGEWFA